MLCSAALMQQAWLMRRRPEKGAGVVGKGVPLGFVVVQQMKESNKWRDPGYGRNK